MLKLTSISLFQFKNYKQKTFHFPERITGICGNNGVGKTNLLDAIHYLCFTKSYFSRLDNQHVQHGADGFRLEGDFIVNDKAEKAVCILRETGKKEFAINNQFYEKFSAHIGHYPCVVIAPDDAILITGDSKERRSFIDSIISQLNEDYLQDLITHKKVLEQRNYLLKSFAESGKQDFPLLDVLDNQIATVGERIFSKRKDFLLSFLPVVKKIYAHIAANDEFVDLIYESELLKAEYLQLLKINRQRDCLAQRTSSGIHKDDLVFQLSGQQFKNIASQGQRKSLLFALKLAELEVLKQEKGFAPLLLLDDVFEKLDEERVSKLLHKVCVENEGQVLITDTSQERLTAHLQQHNLNFNIISL
jgi:DNA replication and repair protein RecF